MKTKDDELAGIIEKGLEKYQQKMVGAIIRPEIANQVATRDAIRRFANGTGDLNPLWISEDYAKRSIYGDIVAPPFFLTAISEGQAIIGLPGLITTFVGAEWEWHRSIRVNDSFSVTNQLLELKDKGNQETPYRFLQSGIIRYVNQNGQVVGSCKWNAMRTASKLAGKSTPEKEENNRSRKPGIKIHQYSKEELNDIYGCIDREEVRGANARYWEDVQPGDELIPVVKGPLGLSDMVAYAIGTGWHRVSLAHGAKLSYLRAKPGLSYIDPDTGAPEPVANSHFQDTAAKVLMGSPIAIDLGFQRVCWHGHLVTNWLGDYGFLKKLSCRLQQFVRFGDTNWCKGRVTGKKEEKGEHLVQLELTLENQRGETTATAEATVSLPSKSGARVSILEGSV